MVIQEEQLEYVEYMQLQQLEARLDEITYDNKDLFNTWQRIVETFHIGMHEPNDGKEHFLISNSQKIEF